MTTVIVDLIDADTRSIADDTATSRLVRVSLGMRKRRVDFVMIV
jgi:hypothetical protein